jgi:hypothetical protein
MNGAVKFATSKQGRIQDFGAGAGEILSVESGEWKAIADCCAQVSRRKRAVDQLSFGGRCVYSRRWFLTSGQMPVPLPPSSFRRPASYRTFPLSNASHRVLSVQFMNDIYDVAIIGGGPAGSTAACLLAKAGNINGGFAIWWRMQLFYLVVFLQKFAALCPRLSLNPPSATTPSPTATTCVP